MLLREGVVGGPVDRAAWLRDKASNSSENSVFHNVKKGTAAILNLNVPAFPPLKPVEKKQ